MIQKKKPANIDVLVVKFSPINGLTSSMMRTLALVKGLLMEGYCVELLTIRESSSTVVGDVKKYKFLDDICIAYADSNVTYDKMVSSDKGLGKHLVKGLRKIYHIFYPYDYTMNIANHVSLKILSKKHYKYIISISDPKSSHRAVRKLIAQGLKYKKWIQYWGDPLATDITKTSIYPKFITKIFEKGLFGKADSIVYTSPYTLKEQKKLFGKYADKMKYVPTAYIEEKKYLPHKGAFTIGYYGAYYSSVRNILPLYESCSSLSGVDLIIVGDSDISLEPQNNIFVYPRGDVGKFEEKTDLFICLLNSSGNQIPGKFYYYAGTNKPVLVLLDGDNIEDIKNDFDNYQRYIFCRNDTNAIKESINTIMFSKRDYQPCKEMSCESVARAILEE